MANQRSINLLKLGNIFFFLVTVTVNGLANAVKFGGKSTGELSDAIPNLFVPAGLTFAVWGAIYLLLLVFVVFQARGLFGIGRDEGGVTKKIGVLFMISCIANAGWIFAWHYRLVDLSLAIMLILISSLIGIYLKLKTGREKTTTAETWFVRLPFSVYLGWITVATIANVTALLVVAGWDGFGLGEVFWTVVMIGAALVITALMLIIRRDVAYSLVIVWALLGIYIKRSSEQVQPVPEVAYAALAALVAISLGIVLTGVRLFWERRKSIA